jgi:hypothetical protein
MNALVAGLLAFAIAFGCALLGMGLRHLLPPHHLNAESRDAIKITVAVIATMAGLVVGLMITTAKSSFEGKDSEIKKIAARIVLLDQMLKEYGPETVASRNELKMIVERAKSSVWNPADQKLDIEAPLRYSGLLTVQRILIDLEPRDEARRWAKTVALRLTEQIEDERAILIQNRYGAVRWPFVMLLIVWFAIIFASFGLVTPRNVTTMTMLGASAASVATALYIIVQMDAPYSGFMQLSSAPLDAALVQMAK